MTPRKRRPFALIEKLNLSPAEKAFAKGLEETLEPQIVFWNAQGVRMEVIRAAVADQVESIHLIAIGKIVDKQAFSIIDGMLTEPIENAYARSLAMCLFHQVKHLLDHMPTLRIEVIGGAFAEALELIDVICRKHPCSPRPPTPPPNGTDAPP